MKRIVKWLLIVGSVLSVLYTAYIIYRFYKNHELLQLYIGMGKVDGNQLTLAPVSDKKNKFLGHAVQETYEAFDHFMAEKGWIHTSDFGRCTLYQNQGREVLVRKTTVFNRYTLFEVLDSKYVEDFNENLLEIA